MSSLSGRKALAVFLSVMITMAYMPLNFAGIARAADNVAASIGSEQYASLEEAFEAAGQGDVIKLESDVSEQATIEVGAGKTVTLDLNGHSVETGLKQEGRHYYFIDNYGTFTLKDSAGGGSVTARGIENLEGGSMTIESGTVTACDTNGGAAIWNVGSLVVNGGTLKATYAGSASDKYGAGCLNNSGTATINGGTFDSVNLRTYAIISTGSITIEDADVTGAHGGLAVDGGTAIVNGGSFTSTEYYGLYVSNDAAKAGVSVNGGTFEGKTTAVWIGSDVNSSVDSRIEITGGTFVNGLKVQNNVEDPGIVITGGTYPNTDVEQYLANGLKLSDNGDGTYTMNDTNWYNYCK